MAAKVNPRKVPKTKADVDAAWRQGVIDGVNNATALFMMVLVDKYDARDKVRDIWADINKLSGEINEGRLTFADIRTTLKEEYDLLV